MSIYKKRGYIVDIEADNFYLQSTQIWYIYFQSLDGVEEMELYPSVQPKEYCRNAILEWHKSFGDNPLVITYNGIGYDLFMLWKFFDISFHIGKDGKDYLDKTLQFECYDLYVLSQYLNPDRWKHSLASWGEELGNEKIEFDDWSQYSEEMRTYCKQDVGVTYTVFKKLTDDAIKLYGEKWIHTSFKVLQKDYYLYVAQEYTGVKFNREAAQKLVEEIEGEMALLDKEVLPQLPPRKLKKTEEKDYKFPAKPFKANGEFSSHMLNFIEKHSAKVSEDGLRVKAYGKVYTIESNKILDVKLPMEIGDNGELKDWFLSKGWVPTMHNVKKNPETGKPERDKFTGEPIQTSPKIQEAGKICPNLLALDGELPKLVVKYLSLRNRKSVVSGWLSNWRLDFDGRLSASITGYTPTFRVKHSNIVNLPKASPEVVKGYEVRSLFIVEDGMKYVSGDAAALENRTVADYTFKYDDGKYAEMILSGDSHSVAAKAIFPEETKGFDIFAKDFNKDDPKFKPYRNKGKTANYLLSYGGSAKKLGRSLGLPESRSQTAYDNYWNANLGLKLFKEAIENYWATTGKKKRIIGRDGKYLMARSKHLLVNLAGQNLGATVITLALCDCDDCLGWLQLDSLGRPYYDYNGSVVKRIAAFHDQGDFETEPAVAEEVGQMIIAGIVKSGEKLKMKIKLDGEYKIGNNAAEIH